VFPEGGQVLFSEQSVDMGPQAKAKPNAAAVREA
jgi:hypothetical protein